MRYGVTPFQLSAKTWHALSDIGIARIPWDESANGESDVTLLYDSPDQLIAMAAAGDSVEEWKPRRLVQGYRSLLARFEHTRQPLLSISHLLRRGHQGLAVQPSAEDISGAVSRPSPDEAPALSPERAACVLSLIEAEPALLEAYQDLELRAELQGREPDLRYRDRLRQVARDGDALMLACLASQRMLAASLEQEQRLAELQECLTGKETALQEARADVELTVLQLHQVQEELEQIFLADREKQRLLDAGAQDLEALRARHETMRIRQDQELESTRQAYDNRLADLQAGLAAKETALQEAREEVKLTLLQLNQVQEELEHYFLESRANGKLATAQMEQLRRAQSLLTRLQPGMAFPNQKAAALNVEVLTGVTEAHPGQFSLQTEALLKTYASSLERASALLERARLGQG
jgi:hypothetical protein